MLGGGVFKRRGLFAADSLPIVALVVVDKRASLEGVLVVFATDTFAMGGAQNSRLKTLAILLEAARLFAGAALHVVVVVLCLANIVRLHTLLC